MAEALQQLELQAASEGEALLERLAETRENAHHLKSYAHSVTGLMGAAGKEALDKVLAP